LGIHDKKTIGILVVRRQHISEHLRKYFSAYKPMPVAVAIGNDPVIPIAAASNFEAGVSEVKMAGALKQKPIKLVRCGQTICLYQLILK